LPWLLNRTLQKILVDELCHRSRVPGRPLLCQRVAAIASKLLGTSGARAGLVRSERVAVIPNDQQFLARAHSVFEFVSLAAALANAEAKALHLGIPNEHVAIIARARRIHHALCDLGSIADHRPTL